MTKKAMSFRLSDDARSLILAIARKLGTSQATAVELAVRKLAKYEHVGTRQGAKELEK